MNIHDKEILLDELEAHLIQVQDCILGNPFINLEHTKLWQLVRWDLYEEKYGDQYDDADQVDQSEVFIELDRMMREIIDLR